MKTKEKSTKPRMTPTTKEKKKLKQDVLSTYFQYHINRCTKSENSGVGIYNPTKANICHLFPKSNHPSVMANLDNCIYLTLEEHTRFDELLFRHEFKKLETELPQAWQIAKERMEKVAPLVIERTKFFVAFVEYVEDSLLW